MTHLHPVLHDRLSVLVVDDEPDLRAILARTMQRYGMAARTAATTEEALRILTSFRELRLPLDAITSDLRRPAGDGIEFLKSIRNLPDEACGPGGLRIRHTPFIFYSATASYYKDVIHEIDPTIEIVDKGNRDLDQIFRSIADSIGRYRHNLLDELQHLGLGIVWNNGRYHLLSAYSLPAQLETKYFSGNSVEAGTSYTRIVLITSSSRFSHATLDLFEHLINTPRVSERDIHEFLTRHPDLLLDEVHDTYWSELPLQNDFTGKKIRLDFLLQPLGKREYPDRWTIVDLKRASHQLIVNEDFHPDLSKVVYRLITQLRDYSEFFSDPRNEKSLRQFFGGVVPRPRLVGVIGRKPRDQELFAKLKGRITDVQLTTYDEILEFRRARADFLARVGL